MATISQEMTDEALVEALRADPQNPGLHSLLYQRYSKLIYAFFRYKGLEKENAEDLMHEVFFKFLTKSQEFRGESAVKTYLYVIANNKFLDWVRSAGVSRVSLTLPEEMDSLIDGLSAEISTPETAELAAELKRCVRRIFARYARDNQLCSEIIVLGLLMDAKLKQVASVIDKSHGATREYLRRCRAKLKPLLAPCRQLQGTG